MRGFSRPRGEQRARHGADRHHRREEPVSSGADVEGGDRHGRDEDREVHPERADQEQHEKNRPEVGPAPDIAEARDQAARSASAAPLRMQIAHPQERERAEHAAKRQRVHEENPTRADAGDQQARKGGPHHARGIERRGVERHGVRQVGLANQIRDEGLARGRIEGRGAAEQEGEHVDMPELHRAGEREQPRARGRRGPSAACVTIRSLRRSK